LGRFRLRILEKHPEIGDETALRARIPLFFRVFLDNGLVFSLPELYQLGKALGTLFNRKE
jgi:hypothetical protein